MFINEKVRRQKEKTVKRINEEWNKKDMKKEEKKERKKVSRTKISC
jgi:hypothetical protein